MSQSTRWMLGEVRNCCYEKSGSSSADLFGKTWKNMENHGKTARQWKLRHLKNCGSWEDRKLKTWCSDLRNLYARGTGSRSLCCLIFWCGSTGLADFSSLALTVAPWSSVDSCFARSRASQVCTAFAPSGNCHSSRLSKMGGSKLCRSEATHRQSVATQPSFYGNIPSGYLT